MATPSTGSGTNYIVAGILALIAAGAVVVSTTSSFVIKGSSSGSVTLTVPAAAGSNTVAIPAASGSLPLGPTGAPITFAGPTLARTVTFPDSSFTIARTDAENTFAGHQTIEGVTSTGATGTNLLVFGTAPTLASPVFTSPALGTVASGVISSCTSTSMVMVTPVLGTPTSGTLTNCTGLPAAGVTPQTINAQSGTTYTFAAGDAQEIVTGSNGGATTFSIPTNGVTPFAVNTQIVVIQVGAGALTIQAVNSGTTTVTSAGATSAAPIINAQWCACVCLKTATDTWVVFGNVK